MRTEAQCHRRSNVVRAIRLWAVVSSCCVTFFNGCSKGPDGGETARVDPPAEFTDTQGTWVRSGEELAAQDDQKIGQFFNQHPDLVGSPEWTGTPVKYELKGANQSHRFYWFHGDVEDPFWNALEVNGRSIRDLYGTGIPGVGG